MGSGDSHEQVEAENVLQLETGRQQEGQVRSPEEPDVPDPLLLKGPHDKKGRGQLLGAETCPLLSVVRERRPESYNHEELNSPAI